jgi:ribosomal protein S18 acetylase RimI-like enzyme
MTPNGSAIVRPATDADVDVVQRLDRMRVASSSSQSVDELIGGRPRQLMVATIRGEIVGYAVLGTLFEYDFLELLFVRPDHRRNGIGGQLVAAAEASTGSRKLFTSTNQSNEPMRRLCERLGFVWAGTVEGLDDDDPELFYLRRL